MLRMTRLVLEVLVRGDQHLEPSRLSSRDEFAILQAGPSALVRCFHDVAGMCVAQWGRRVLIKENEHSRHRQGSTCSVLQHTASLLDGNALEPLNELVHRGIVFEVLKERGNRHARTAKDPRATQDGWILFHSGTSRPVNHAEDGSTRRCSVGPKTVHCRDSWSRPLWPVALWRTVHGLPLHGARECDIPNTGFNRLRWRGGTLDIVCWAEDAHLAGLPQQPATAPPTEA